MNLLSTIEQRVSLSGRTLLANLVEGQAALLLPQLLP